MDEVVERLSNFEGPQPLRICTGEIYDDQALRMNVDDVLDRVMRLDNDWTGRSPPVQSFAQALAVAGLGVLYPLEIDLDGLYTFIHLSYQCNIGGEATPLARKAVKQIIEKAKRVGGEYASGRIDLGGSWDLPGAPKTARDLAKLVKAAGSVSAYNKHRAKSRIAGSGAMRDLARAAELVQTELEIVEQGSEAERPETKYLVEAAGTGGGLRLHTHYCALSPSAGIWSNMRDLKAFMASVCGIPATVADPSDGDLVVPTRGTLLDLFLRPKGAPANPDSGSGGPRKRRHSEVDSALSGQSGKSERSEGEDQQAQGTPNANTVSFPDGTRAAKTSKTSSTDKGETEQVVQDAGVEITRENMSQVTAASMEKAARGRVFRLVSAHNNLSKLDCAFGQGGHITMEKGCNDQKCEKLRRRHPPLPKLDADQMFELHQRAKSFRFWPKLP
jgi:hypothetical protein